MLKWESNSSVCIILVETNLTDYRFLPQCQAEEQQGSLHQPGDQVAAAVLKERH